MKHLLLLLLAFSALFVGCKKDDEKPADTGQPALQLPDTYNFTTFNDNTVDARAITANFDALVTAMQVGRNSSSTVTAATLEGHFTAGTLSLSDITETAYLDSVNNWFDVLAANSGRVYDTLNVPNANGGTLAGYLFDGTGTEMEQLIEKGLFSAALYRRALTEHLTGTITAADIDQAFVYYGANIAFPNSNTDKYSARYAARRDNGGFYRNLKTHFLTARVAIAENRSTELNNAVAGIKDQWEKALAATIINYLYSTSDRLSAANVNFPSKGLAWHAWSEGVGFLLGLRAIPQEHRRITTAQIDEILDLMGATHPRNIYSFDTPSELANLTTAINNLATIYSFADPSIFRRNDVNDRNPSKNFDGQDE